MHNKRLFLLIAALLLTHSFQVKGKESISIAIVSLQPLLDLTHGKPHGPLATYIEEEVFSRTPYKIRWVQWPFSRVITSLKDGSLDGFIPFIVNEERAKYVHWTTAPFLSVNSGICFNKREKRAEGSTLRTGENLVVTVMDASPPPEEMLRPNLKLKPVAGKFYIERSAKMLELNYVDGIYHPFVISLVEQFIKHKDTKIIFCEYLRRNPLDVRPAFSKKINSTKLKIIDEAFSKANKDRPLKKYLKEKLSDSYREIIEESVNE